MSESVICPLPVRDRQTRLAAFTLLEQLLILGTSPFDILHLLIMHIASKAIRAETREQSPTIHRETYDIDHDEKEEQNPGHDRKQLPDA